MAGGDFQLLTVHKSWSLGHYEVNALFNPILHTAWLDNHALTLKSNNAKYHIGEKSHFFAYLPIKIVENQGKYKSSSKPFYLQYRKCLEKNLNGTNGQA
jgi:hypothetical protein